MMFPLTYFIISFLIGAFFLWYKAQKRKYADLDKLPGPPAHPLYGNALEFGNSIVGDLWKKHRRILTPAFHLKILEQFSDTFHKYGQVLIKKLKKEEGKNIDIYEYIILYAMDAICDSAMRIEGNAQETGDRKYIEAVKRFLEVYLVRFFSLFNRYEFFFQFTHEYKQYKKDIELLQSFTRKILEQRIRERSLTGEVEEDVDDFGRKKRKKVFLDILLDSDSLSDKEIREEIDTFMFGGHDTVSSTISFGIFELAKHPDVQEKLLEEIQAVVGTNTLEPITTRHLNDMPYFDRVVREILRLYPAAPLIERELEEDIFLEGLKYPKGTTISFHLYIQHRREELFPEPDKFDPDRFLPENVNARHKFAYIPFSAGPRNCIGQKYATINTKITIANILRNFTVHPVVPTHNAILANDAVLKAVNGLPIILKSRN